ncbi:uncharacterized protein P884DRAFT_255222 [Thermothelomyces heterothallicus CBS 202.75]|uniref:uncharacterized protein n=1 Tax=Thermothelomyces heterothallicus CBS 202.75 TaxID=1149848 RepID=UPI00374337E7
MDWPFPDRYRAHRTGIMKPRSGAILSDRQDGRAAVRWEASYILIHETGHKKLDGSGFRLRFATGLPLRPGGGIYKD